MTDISFGRRAGAWSLGRWLRATFFSDWAPHDRHFWVGGFRDASGQVLTGDLVMRRWHGDRWEYRAASDAEKFDDFTSKQAW